MPVYPHWRGEHEGEPEVLEVRAGLSPLARGTPGKRYAVTINHRFIPTGAGNTLKGPKGEPAPAVYPHWRGEHHEVFKGLQGIAGLSPLARGTLNRYSR